MKLINARDVNDLFFYFLFLCNEQMYFIWCFMRVYIYEKYQNAWRKRHK